ncbi:MAG TPA: hypothetical protein VGR57_15265 [Ktedonobacterales bacterium]|nr:hypothetical protein [Ktedonobacterales bacterium]
MMANEPPTPLAQPRTATPPAEETRFDRAAMISGRSLYWDSEPTENALRVFTLIRWCLHLPETRLGISPYDVARILRSVYSAPSGNLAPDAPPDVVQLFERYGVVNLQASAALYASQRWVERRDVLTVWLTEQGNRGGYIWLEANDADWWLNATLESLLSYTELFDRNIDSAIIYDLLGRHRCTVFAPFAGGAMWDHLVALVDAIPDPHWRATYRRRLDRAPLNRESCERIEGSFWSWRLIDFADADGSIIYTPLFAAWSYWPESAEWAPPTLANVTTNPSFSNIELAQLLNNVFWVQLETLFGLARIASGLGQASSDFAGIETRPPVFFYADPHTPPRYPEQYARSLREFIAPLVSGCLLSQDALSAQVAWGLVEGNLVTLRSEISNSEYYFPRYLLLPTLSSRLRGGIELDIGTIANQLTYLEFTIGLEARYTYTALDPLAARGALWGGTLDTVADVTGDAADLLASAGRNHIKTINRRLTSLNMILRRLETFIEKAASDSYEVQRKHTSYIDGTDDFMRRQLTESVVPRIVATNLREALLNAYPYQYVKEPLKTLQSTMRDVRDSVQRSSGTIDTILEQADRQSREALAILGRWVGALVTLLALVVGLLQVVGQQSTSINNGTSPAYKSFIQQYLPWLPTVTPLVFAALGMLLVIFAFIYGGQWIAQALPHKRHEFIEQVQRFRAMVAAAEALRGRALAAQAAAADTAEELKAASLLWADLERLDEDASKLLATLWDDLRAARQRLSAGNGRMTRTSRGIAVHTPGMSDWEFKAHVLEHTIELFDLVPRRIALPRALCVLRFKSGDFYSRSTIPAGDFYVSLRSIGMRTEEIRTLEQWLTMPENQYLIRETDAAAFVRVLQSRGVTVIAERRDPDWWQGPLELRS